MACCRQQPPESLPLSASSSALKTARYVKSIAGVVCRVTILQQASPRAVGTPARPPAAILYARSDAGCLDARRRARRLTPSAPPASLANGARHTQRSKGEKQTRQMRTRHEIATALRRRHMTRAPLVRYRRSSITTPFDLVGREVCAAKRVCVCKIE